MTWINFRELREKLDFREVLAYYNVEVHAKNGVQHHGKCPLPTHDGQRSPSFSANLDKKIWRCFSCGAQGNLLDFACRMERLDPEKPEDIRQVAINLARHFGLVSEKPRGRGPAETKKAGQSRDRCPAVTNAPLDFELKGLDPQHPYLAKRGFTPATAAHFGIGYCARGLMQGRIAIPLRGAHGQLIGYAGRVIDDGHISDENPKYRFPAPREHDGKRLEFSKSLFLYNGHAISAPVEDAIVVEGFPSVWWLHQNGFPNVVGLMGANMSPEQAALLVGMVPRQGHVWIFSDGNQAGRYCAEGVFRLVAPYRFVRWVELKDGRKPTSCNESELRQLLQ